MALSVSMRDVFVPQISSQEYTPITFDVTPNSSGAPYDFQITDNNGDSWAVHPSLPNPSSEWHSPAGVPASITIGVPTGRYVRVKVRDRANNSITALASSPTKSGPAFAFIGDSTANSMLQSTGAHFSTGTGSIAQPTADVQTTLITNGAAVTPYGHGMVSFLNRIVSNLTAQATGLNTTWGGVPLTLLGANGKFADSIALPGCYMAGAAGANDVMAAHLTDRLALGGRKNVNAVIVSCGFHDNAYVTDVQFKDGLERLKAIFDRDALLRNCPAPLFVVMKPYSPITNLDNVRDGVDLFGADHPEALIFNRDSYTHSDGYHLDGDQQIAAYQALADAVCAKGLP